MYEEDFLQSLKTDLYSNDGPERVGFIVNKEVVEVENIHPDPRKYFEVSIEAVEQYLDQAEAIWHSL